MLAKMQSGCCGFDTQLIHTCRVQVTNVNPGVVKASQACEILVCMFLICEKLVAK